MPSVMDKAFLIWLNAGIEQFQDLYHNGTFVSFQYLCYTFNIPRTQFFRFLQIHNFIRNMSSIFPRQPSYTSYDHILNKPLSFKGIISIIYSALTVLSPSFISDIKFQWESELGEPICDESWESALSRVHSSSVCARHELLQFKTLHRIHWTKFRLSKRFSDADLLSAIQHHIHICSGLAQS